MPKSEDCFRMILYLKRLNENMPYIHFKRETIKYILTLVPPNCYMAKVDIKDAYYSVPILPEHQKYLKFYFRGNIYQFTCLPNGSGPRIFTKLLKCLLSHLRLQQVAVARFIDDLITLGRSFVECERNIKLCNSFDSLGFVLHQDKSVFVLARSVEYLGFATDSQSMTISLTQNKKSSIKELCQSQRASRKFFDH